MLKRNLPCGIREMRLLLFFVVSCFPALAQSNSVSSFAYGPQTFTRASNAPAVQTVMFSVPPLVDGPFTLIVQSGPGGDLGTISLNGVQLFGIRDFQNKGTLQALVTLNTGIDETTGEAATNTLAVELMGNPLGSIRISVVGYSYEFASDYALIPQSNVMGSDDVDWRTKGVVTPVKNEGSCHSDWAFSATGVVEGALALKTGILSSLSEQQLLDCTPPASSCADSSPAGALRNVIANHNGGMDSESSYPYTAEPGTCKQSSSPVGSITSLQWSTGGEAGLARQIVYQPVSVVFNGNWLSTYKSGVADPASCGTEPPQYVAGLVVGEINTGVPHWIIKLSQGTSFGMSGYVELIKGKNACGIGNYALTAQ